MPAATSTNYSTLAATAPRHPAARLWRRGTLCLGAALATLLLLTGCSDGGDSDPAGSVPTASVTGPITDGSRGFPATLAVEDLDAAGYIEEEFFLSGEARAYDKAGEWTADGIWPVDETASADYTTRILVRRPVDPARFSGVVVVEWFNVTSGIDLAPDFGYLNGEILREGHAWVGVSAQAVGIEGTGGGPLGADVTGLLLWDPERYYTLHHPGDAYSYDIFSQVAATLRQPGPNDPLSGLQPQMLLADGESQSAFRLLTYVNAIHPEARVYDGFLIHSRNGSGAPLNDSAEGEVPAPARVRTDLDAPVFQFVTETDLFELGEGPQSFPQARQPDSQSVHTWEVAGTAHADATYLTSLIEQGKRQFDDFRDLTPVLSMVNSAPQNLVMNAALHALVDWVANGTPPASAPVIDTADGAIARDARGNALGGMRLPHSEVPVALLSGEDGIPLSGRTVPFDQATLDVLYPTPASYIDAVRKAAQAAVDAGYLLPVDAQSIVEEAENKPPVN